MRHSLTISIMIFVLCLSSGCIANSNNLPESPGCDETLIQLYENADFKVIYWRRSGVNPSYGLPAEVSFENANGLTLEYLSSLSLLEYLREIDFSNSDFDEHMVPAIIRCENLQVLRIDNVQNMSVSGLRKIALHQNLDTVLASGLVLTDTDKLEIMELNQEIVWAWEY